MKRFAYILLVLTLASAFAIVGSASAEGTWNTGIDIQNLTATAGTVVVEFYDADGNSVGPPLSDTIAAWGALNFYLPHESSPPDGKYSAVISSSVDIAATAGTANYALGGADIYLGTSEPTDALSFPLVYRNHTSGLWNTEITIQNASSSAQTVNLYLYTAGETSHDATDAVTIQVNGYHTFDISDGAYAAFGPFGSAVVEGSAELAGVAHNIRNPGTGSVNVIETYYRAFSGGQVGVDAIAPLVYKRYNLWTTGVNVLNLGSLATTVTITYTNSNPAISGGPWIDSMVLGANAMDTFYTPSNGDLPDGFFGSATLSSSDADMAVVVSSQRYRPDGAQGVAYEASLPSDATSCVSLPVTHNRTTWKTGINILNLGGSDAQITIDYYSSILTIPDATHDVVVPANSPLTIYMPSESPTALGFAGAADIKSTNGQPILVNASHARKDKGVASTYVGLNYTCP